jgi:hypothetical protein
MIIRKLFNGFIGFAVVMLVGCGGGGGAADPTSNATGSYTGSTTPAAVTSSNAQELGVDATEAASKAIESNSASAGGLPFGASVTGTSTPLQQVQAINDEILKNLQGVSLPAGITLDSSYFTGVTGYCGGSVTIPDSWTTGSSTNPDGTITYNNFCLDIGSIYGQLTANGSVTISGGVSTYSNFTVTFANGTILSCNGSTCSNSAVYSGTGGTTSLVSNVTVSGNASAGYNITASYCHSTYGCLTIQTNSPILFNCLNGKPSSGSVTYSSSNGSSGTITFNDCSSYTITYTTTAGGGVTSISGVW